MCIVYKVSCYFFFHLVSRGRPLEILGLEERREQSGKSVSRLLLFSSDGTHREPDERGARGLFTG